jgi:hypothetical protein
LKKFLFGISSKLFNGRREEARCRALLRDAFFEIIYEQDFAENPFPNVFP